METLQTFALAALLAWASGIRLYFVVFAVGLAGYLDYVELPQGLHVLEHPWVIGAAGFMLAMEFLVDKIPGLDTVVAGLLGGTITAGTHFTKAGSRAVINTSPEPVSNWGASLTEDAMVLGGIWFAFQHPVVFLVLLGLFAALAIWLLPKLIRGIRALLRQVSPPLPAP